MRREIVVEPGTYKHYKGGLYRVLLDGVVNEGTNEAGVVYVTLTVRAEPDAEQHRLTWRPYFGLNGWLTRVPSADGLTARFERVS